MLPITVNPEHLFSYFSLPSFPTGISRCSCKIVIGDHIPSGCQNTSAVTDAPPLSASGKRTISPWKIGTPLLSVIPVARELREALADLGSVLQTQFQHRIDMLERVVMLIGIQSVHVRSLSCSSRYEAGQLRIGNIKHDYSLSVK